MEWGWNFSNDTQCMPAEEQNPHSLKSAVSDGLVPFCLLAPFQWVFVFWGETLVNAATCWFCTLCFILLPSFLDLFFHLILVPSHTARGISGWSDDHGGSTPGFPLGWPKLHEESMETPEPTVQISWVQRSKLPWIPEQLGILAHSVFLIVLSWTFWHLRYQIRSFIPPAVDHIQSLRANARRWPCIQCGFDLTLNWASCGTDSWKSAL